MKNKKPKLTVVISCRVCGDTGTVYLAYLEPGCSANRAKDRMPCPKCSKGKR